MRKLKTDNGKILPDIEYRRLLYLELTTKAQEAGISSIMALKEPYIVSFYRNSC